MGIFSFLGATVGRPYIRVAKDVGKSLKNIQEDLDVVANAKNAASKKKEESIYYIDAEDGKSAFKLIYEKNGWNKEQLDLQKTMIRRAKRIFIVLTIFLVAGFFASAVLSSNIFFGLLFCGFFGLGATLMAVKTTQFAIYETQLQERNLLRFNEFMGRPDFWRRIFS